MTNIYVISIIMGSFIGALTLFYLSQKIQAKIAERKERGAQDHEARIISMSIRRDLIRYIGCTILAIGVFGILLRSPFEKELTQKFTKRLENNILTTLRQSPGVTGAVLRQIVHPGLIYSDFRHSFTFVKTIDDSCYFASDSSQWKIKNSDAKKLSWEGKILRTGIESDRTSDHYLIIRDFKGNTLATWHKDSNDLPCYVKWDLHPNDSIIATHKCIKKTFMRHYYLLNLRRPCDDSLTFSLILPDNLEVEVQFLLPEEDQGYLCEFTKNNAPDAIKDGFCRYTAIIRGGILPFQGIFVEWEPK